MSSIDLPLMQYKSTRYEVPRVSPAQYKKNTEDGKKLYEACSEFEAIFIKQMLDSMRKTVNKSGLMEGGMAEEIFEDMLYDEYAKALSKHANFGIKDLLFKQLSV